MDVLKTSLSDLKDAGWLLIPVSNNARAITISLCSFKVVLYRDFDKKKLFNIPKL